MGSLKRLTNTIYVSAESRNVFDYDDAGHSRNRHLFLVFLFLCYFADSNAAFCLLHLEVYMLVNVFMFI